MPPQACLNVGEIPTGIVPGAGRIGAADSSGSQNSGPCHGITRSSPSDQVPRLLFWDWPWASCNHKRRKAQKPSTKVTPLSWHGALRWLHHHHPWEPLPNREEYPLPLSNSQSRVQSLLSWAWISCRYPLSWSPGALRYPQMETTLHSQSHSCASAGNHPSLTPSGSETGCVRAVPTPPSSHFHPSSPAVLESRLLFQGQQLWPTLKCSAGVLVTYPHPSHNRNPV